MTPLPAPEGPHRHTFPSPLGHLTVTAEGGRLTHLSWSERAPRADPGPPDGLLTEAEQQIKAYFAGRAPSFDLPLGPPGTAFQARVWQAIAAIPFGACETYGSLARTLCSGPRAVGNAAGANPLPIIVPCHRVLAAGGAVGGYSGNGGLETKAVLLRLEGIRFSGYNGPQRQPSGESHG
jgi:methylated-DNA-[protein]-cysteine S-methyltransferase